jgi:hypothetical protein
MEARPPILFDNSLTWEEDWQQINPSLHWSAYHLINGYSLHINFMPLNTAGQQAD